ncbi:hypothetical protein GQ53DRAFT_777441 [Thozetella sp. PMI_491]|nr:hypothetical protein GQ53DRAFT_777441 [Thozetella sp. PMI_491]
MLALLFCAGLSLLALWSYRDVIHTAWTLAALPIFWSRGASQFVISQRADDFDVTFSNYSASQDHAGAPYSDLVPPVLHHISLGDGPMRPSWQDARQACIDWHPGWETNLWTNENARDFVAERFPEMLATWDGYRFLVEKIDALRYMVLYEYGGVILDLDLKCKRSLGPLRRFSFVAPAANPTGFSVGFMMASKGNAFVRKIVDNLPKYDHHWFGLPYATVMFSTGCHFASTIHLYEPDRTSLKILSGPESDPKMHKLSGHVSTPLFDHLGSSSWHSYDAHFLRRAGRVFKLAHRAFFLLGSSLRRLR